LIDFVQGRGGHRNKQQRYQTDRGSYEELKKSNEQFENYYNELAIVPEDERDLFWSVMRAELPNSFRFTGSKG
jgi:multisite-specific tRNA:(cytosine-C5)-methyltransferase